MEPTDDIVCACCNKDLSADDALACTECGVPLCQECAAFDEQGVPYCAQCLSGVGH
ncbi:MAG TPA: hypothetical protein VKK79_17385 [Candidatus Lokiarchaeia archaeon]|nr:hypothetical protein [Candidatus Lokiarchaeia archaeon]